MCNAIGVDPLAASNVKGKSGKVAVKGSWWAQLRKTDDESELHLRLAMRVVEICRASRNEDGGLLGVEGCREKVKKGQGIGGKLDITEYVSLSCHLYNDFPGDRRNAYRYLRTPVMTSYERSIL